PFLFSFVEENIGLPKGNQNNKIGEVGDPLARSTYSGKNPIPSNFPISNSIID
mgnify:CR=1